MPLYYKVQKYYERMIKPKLKNSFISSFDLLKDPVKIKMDGGPTPNFFHPHGIDVSNTTDRLFAINHGDIKSSVEIYKIVYKENCISTSAWSCTPVTLKFLTSVSSELFPKHGINDVAEIGRDNFYVTQWQAFEPPKVPSLHHLLKAK